MSILVILLKKLLIYLFQDLNKLAEVDQDQDLDLEAKIHQDLMQSSTNLLMFLISKLLNMMETGSQHMIYQLVATQML